MVVVLQCYIQVGKRKGVRQIQDVSAEVKTSSLFVSESKEEAYNHIAVHTYSCRHLLNPVVALNPRMAKMDMEAYRDVALFIIPTTRASLSQLFLIEIE